MGKWKRYIPDGMKDILFEECNAKLTIEESLRKSYKQSGFSEIISPTLEFYDVFNLESQPIPQEKMYKLFDNDGRIMVLRPDMTTPIGRIASTKIKQSNYPLRLCYNSNIFRINENLNGKTSEITQSGIEIIGIKNIKADAEAIINAIEALLNLGLKNFKIELGEAKFFKALIEDTEINEEDLEKMRSIIQNKNYVTLSNFLRDKQYGISEDNVEILERLPQLFGDISIIDEARSLTSNQKALEALDNIHNIYKIINEIGLSSYISIDLGMVQNIDYYTGIIFKGYVEEVGDYILSGGRYDNLIKQFGTNLPATGFAINVDNVMDALKKQNTLIIKDTKKILIYYKEEYLKNAYELMNLIRHNDFICELSLFSEESESIEYAKENKIYSMISILGEYKLKIFDLLIDNCSIVEKDKFLNTLIMG